MTILRNMCAHHRRLLDAVIPLQPRNMNKYVTENAGAIEGPYKHFVVVMAFLKRFTRNASWHTQLVPLFEECPLDPYLHMSFPVNWPVLPFWNSASAADAGL